MKHPQHKCPFPDCCYFVPGGMFGCFEHFRSLSKKLKDRAIEGNMLLLDDKISLEELAAQRAAIVAEHLGQQVQPKRPDLPGQMTMEWEGEP